MQLHHTKAKNAQRFGALWKEDSHQGQQDIM